MVRKKILESAGKTFEYFVDSPLVNRDARNLLATLSEEALDNIRSIEFYLFQDKTRKEAYTMMKGSHQDFTMVKNAIIELKNCLCMKNRKYDGLFQHDLAVHFRKNGLKLDRYWTDNNQVSSLSKLSHDQAKQEDSKVRHFNFIISCLNILAKRSDITLDMLTMKKGRPNRIGLKYFAKGLARYLVKDGKSISSSRNEILWILFEAAVSFYELKNVKTRTYIEYVIADK